MATPTMSDVRALLRAKKQDLSISHPLASFSRSGQLKCTVCGILLKHVSAWEGHIGSKGHRTNVARSKEEKRSADPPWNQEQLVRKRKVEELGSHAVEKIRRVVHEESEVDTGGAQAHPLPSSFFSQPPPIPLRLSLSDSEADLDQASHASSKGSGALDLEWAMFQQSVLNAPDLHETYERATVAVEPEMAQKTPEGFPAHTTNPAKAIPSNNMEEGEAQRKKEQDEREIIMDRLLDEERAQEEADSKVNMMKGKLDALRRMRGAAKARKGL